MISKPIQLGAVALIVVAVFVFTVTQPNYEAQEYMLIGGVLGALSSGLVFFLILSSSFESVKRLLMWKSLADFGVALRFILNESINYQVCDGTSNCVLIRANSNSDDYMYENNCGVASAVLEFFEIASELWFLCAAWDLFSTSRNPFSSTKRRLPRYHFFVWTLSSMFAAVTYSFPDAHRFWKTPHANDSTGETALCWVNSNFISVYSWALFYLPLFLVTVGSILLFCRAFFRLRHGLAKSFVHRIKALAVNTVNLTVSTYYWIIVLTLTLVSHNLDGGDVESTLFKVTSWLFASKGITCIVIWIIVWDFHLGANDMRDDDGVNLNSILRNEVLFYATKGIQQTKSPQDLLQLDFHGKTLKWKIEKDEKFEGYHTAITPIFYVKLLLGYNFERKVMTDILQHSSDDDEHPRPSHIGTNTSDGVVDITHITMTSSNALLSQRFSLKRVYSNSIPDPDATYLYDRRSSTAFSSNEIEENWRAVGGARHHLPATLPPTGLPPRPPRPFLAPPPRTSRASRPYSERIQAIFRQAAAPSSSSTSRHSEVILRQFDTTNNAEANYDQSFQQSSQNVVFEEFEPVAFMRIRQKANITDVAYKHYFETTVKERVTQGGASGAFFFFSKDEVFLAKSCTKTEFQVLVRNASKLVEYYDSNDGQHSLISKIYGAYLLHIYTTDIYFFVMANLFYSDPKLSINEKYDIKGSTVNRSFEAPKEGQSSTCRHCEQKFVYRSKKIKRKVFPTPQTTTMIASTSRGIKSVVMMTQLGSTDTVDLHGSASVQDLAATTAHRCPVRVAGHEPNVVMKDNDLTQKLRLTPFDSKQAALQLEKDAFFLSGIGVMDYSLLVGVQNANYSIDELREVQTKSNSASSSVSKSFHATPQYKVGRVLLPQVYVLGIIDYQQEWNVNKKLERFFKIYFKGADGDGLSAIRTDIYRDRFVSHIKDVLGYEDDYIESEIDQTIESKQLVM